MNQKRLDMNCMAGSWPFHKVRQGSFAQLRRVHEKNRICGGMVSATEALFYNDPYEAELDLMRELSGCEGYRQVMTVNPQLPGWREDLDRAAEELHPAGVRIAPGLHGYGLEEIHCLAEELIRRELPLYLTMHLEDERLAYLLQPKPVPVEEVQGLLRDHPGLRVLLCNLRLGEAMQLVEDIRASENVYFDLSGMKDPLFPLEKLEGLGILHRLVYGSFAPLLCVESTVLMVECAQADQEVKDAVFAGNGWI